MYKEAELLPHRHGSRRHGRQRNWPAHWCGLICARVVAAPRSCIAQWGAWLDLLTVYLGSEMGATAFAGWLS